MTSPRDDTRFFGHPAGLSTLFFTELWERFGYYGMRALLILFMTTVAARGGLGYTDSKAYAIYGLYTAGVYLLSLPGGWIADQILGQRRAVFYGGIIISIGYLSLAAPSETIFLCGLPIVVLGTGMLKPNISTIVGQLYRPGDARRDSAFSIFYMGINLGAMIAPLVCGYVGQRINWHWGFGLAGVGMALGVVTFWYGQRRLGGAGLHPATASNPEASRKSKRQLLNGAILAACVVAVALYLRPNAELLVNVGGLVLFAIVIGLFAWMFLGGDWTPEERKRLVVVTVLFTGSALFWSAFEQAGSSLNLFAQRHTANRLLGFSFPSSWFQSLNAAFIIVVAPIFAWLWLKLGNRQPSSPAKFSLGLLFGGLGFVVMIFAARRASAGHLVSPLWLTVTYLCHTVGELLLSPVGLSAMTTLAPARVGGFMMGVWFVSISMGNYLGGRLAALYGDMPMESLFTTIAIFSLCAALLLGLIARPVSRLTGGIK